MHDRICPNYSFGDKLLSKNIIYRVNGLVSPDNQPLAESMLTTIYDARRVINSLAAGRSECDSKNAIFNQVLLIGIFRSS